MNILAIGDKEPVTHLLRFLSAAGGCRIADARGGTEGIAAAGRKPEEEAS